MGTIEEVPEQYAQLKYVLFSWPNTPLLKKDHLAKHFFKHNVTMDTFAQAVGGFPLTVYEAVLPSSSSAAKGTHLGVPELFLPASTCNALISLLAHEMGPSRAQASWKPSAWHSRVELERGCPSGRIRTHCFASQEALENRFAELKDQDDWAASKPHWRELRRAQECWARGVEGARRGALTPVAVAIDIETWEEDHDTITEVGIASVAVRPDGSFEEKTEHYVVAENAHLRNGRYCPDHRDSFQYGTSVVLPSAEISSLLHELLSASSPSSSSSSAPPPPPPPAAPSYSSALSSRTAPPAPPSAPPPPPPLQGPLFLLLHDARSDVKSLSQLDLQMNLFERVLPPPTSPPFSLGLGGSDTKGGAEGATMAFLLDTQKIISGWTRRKKQMKLGDAAAALGVELTHAHNAGNDAYATLHVFLRLMTAFIGTSADEIPESMLRGNAA